MPNNRWQLIESILDQLLEFPVHRRVKELEALIKNDMSLYDEVKNLLKSMEASENFMTVPVADYADKVLHDFAGESNFDDMENVIGRKVGKYRILERLGYGGMGTVYLAERVDGTFERKVALKFIRSELETDHVIQRFERERQFLAALNHNNIAKLYDGGYNEHGIPYLVMEYVEGPSIARYLRENKVSLEEKLSLFIQICDAVHFAHQNLIIHRDLKPSNILVTSRNEIKLLDFGIAKLIKEIESDEPLTKPGIRFMTTHYAAPELIKNQAITTATDVYSLGVILYEMVCGISPYPADKSAGVEIEKLICDQSILKPSLRLKKESRGIGESLTKSDLNKLIRSLQGDLDLILLKAMQKDPAQRYNSVQALSSDILRYLNHEPVEAKTPGLFYKSGKFIQRHSYGVAAVICLPLMIITGLVYHSGQLQKERDQAQLEAAKSAQISSYLIDIFESSDPSQSRGEEITARDLLETGIQNLPHLDDQPELLATMTGILGKVLYSIGDFRESEKLTTKTLELTRELYGPESVEAARVLTDYGVLTGRMGNVEDEPEYHRQALGIYKHIYGDEHKTIAEIYRRLSSSLHGLGNYNQAFEYAEKSLRMNSKLLGQSNEDVAKSYNLLGLLHYEINEYEQAETNWKQAIKIYEQTLGDHHPQTLITMSNLANVLRVKSQFDESEQLFLDILNRRKKVLGEEHPAYTNTLYSLGLVHYQNGNFEQAESYWRKTLERRIEIFGEEHPDVATAMNALSAVFRQQGNYEQTLDILYRLLNFYRRVYGDEHRLTALTLNNLGATYANLDNREKAEELYRTALEMRIRILGDKHSEVARSHQNIATLLHNTNGDMDDALLHAKNAVSIYTEILDKDHQFIRDANQLLAEIEQEMQK